MDAGKDQPVLQNTKLGWVVAGLIPIMPASRLSGNRDNITTLLCFVDHCETLNRNLERFWELEFVPPDNERRFSEEELKCEKYFKCTTTRNSDGRFTVRLPFRRDPSELGESRSVAIRRLNQLERRFQRDKILYERYSEFMQEYLDLDHMSLVSDIMPVDQHPIIYLPHHGVIKEASSSTKLRTVFDASSKTDSKLSLNDVLCVGPTLQQTWLK
ncbi:uncharacterized protein LOC115245686 [Formica exsecta]|uniref:uncharacterized protein LOC115245686 n=1 Tax=Formica exsecta TaxID=72781 RepID=UPI001143E0E6|nr:uncharacterized protein LOC115245686 [Formica exsecta]